MKKQVLFIVFAGLLGSSTLSAQDGWFVDPVAGSDLNGGQSQGDAFKTLTHALTQAGAADNVFCVPGTYSAASGETFPISLKNIRVVAVNVVKLNTDNIDPRKYMGRLEAWQKRVQKAGAAEWRVINDLERLNAIFGKT